MTTSRGQSAAQRRDRCVLTINGGSSSIKFAVYAMGAIPQRMLVGGVERIGLADAALKIKGADGQAPAPERIDAPDHAAAVRELARRLNQRIAADSLVAIGHRIVHGGERYVETSPVDDVLLAELRRLSPLDPLVHVTQMVVSLGYFVVGHYPEASAWAEKALRDQPNFQATIRLLAASKALSGDVEGGRDAIARARRLDPDMRISNLRDRIGPFRPEDFARYESGLRLAGLPE